MKSFDNGAILDSNTKKNTKKKKGAYVERVTQVEKGSFTPFVMSTSGGLGAEAVLFIKRIAELISVK